MPHVWAARPDVKLWIVGKDPTSEIAALAENPNVTVTGFVEDIRPYLQQATVAVAPLTYGAGVQNKVLEAMACATPVITTHQAISALQIEAGQDVLVADQPEQFAQTILNLLNTPQQQEQVGQAGYRYVHTQHHWPNIVARLENIYQNAIHNRQNHHAAPA
jgi:glycosyltransferase involved in cell wall biosynthesis